MSTPHFRCSGGSDLQASAITRALSPDSTMSMPMIWSRPIRKAEEPNSTAHTLPASPCGPSLPLRILSMKNAISGQKSMTMANAQIEPTSQLDQKMEISPCDDVDYRNELSAMSPESAQAPAAPAVVKLLEHVADDAEEQHDDDIKEGIGGGCGADAAEHDDYRRDDREGDTP